mmetsp:Transcript_21009/g.37456  ORF Transcript_21009/g.37456 Transcript_21009/m.37456 type:complete len:136 (-) Transcript_21009:169-576(-)
MFLLWPLINSLDDKLSCWGAKGICCPVVGSYAGKSLGMLLVLEIVLPVSTLQSLAFAVCSSTAAMATSTSHLLVIFGPEKVEFWLGCRFYLVVGGLPVLFGSALMTLHAFSQDSACIVSFLEKHQPAQHAFRTAV